MGRVSTKTSWFGRFFEQKKSLYKKKPSEYLGHLIGHEGEGSVLSLLRYKRWATGVYAGVMGSGYNKSSCCATFCVTFYLTKVIVQVWDKMKAAAAEAAATEQFGRCLPLATQICTTIQLAVRIHGADTAWCGFRGYGERVLFCTKYYFKACLM